MKLVKTAALCALVTLAACKGSDAAPAAESAAAAPAVMPEAHREAQVKQLELQRKTLVAMVDSMPERLLHDKATPAQRDFSQQIYHASSSVPGIVQQVLKAPAPATPLAEEAAATASRESLKAYVNSAFDYAGGVLRSQSPAERMAEVDLFGMKMPAWQVWDEIHTHSIWTAGQIVGNFRKNGMAPPEFGFF